MSPNWISLIDSKNYLNFYYVSTFKPNAGFKIYSINFSSSRFLSNGKLIIYSNIFSINSKPSSFNY